MKKLLAFFLGLFAAMALPAYGHVKWFSETANTASVPQSPYGFIYSANFLTLTVLAIAVLLFVTFVDFRVATSKNRITKALHALDIHMSPVFLVLLRIGVAIFFFSLATYFRSSPIILTPELKTDAAWVPIVQIAIALLVLFPRTARVAALGIVLLYLYAIREYGWFHMLDYPFFIGVAAFFAINEEFDSGRHLLKLAILRVTTGLSFLWVAVEKWMYPDWSYDVLQHGLESLLMGLDPSFFVMAAGMVEFCLGFLLLFGRLSSQVSAAILFLLMVSAIPMVGVVDAIGHAPAIVVLFILSTAQNRPGHLIGYSEPWDQSGKPLAFLVSIPGLIGLYYVVHELAYPTYGIVLSKESLIGALMMLPMILVVLRSVPYTFRRVVCDARRPIRLAPALST